MPENDLLNNPLAIVGDADIVSGFKALGFKVYPVIPGDDLSKVFERVVSENAGVCLVQEDVYTAGKNEIQVYQSMPLPIFIPFAKTGEIALLDELVKGVKLRATGTLK